MEFATEEMAPTTEETRENRYLTFRLDGTLFGIDIRVVTEIVGMQKFDSVPEMPSYGRGIINLRGRIIPLIDMRLRLHRPEAEYNERTCIIIVDRETVTAGLIVDGVDEVTPLPDAEIAPPPDSSTGYDSDYIAGIGKKDEDVIFILDCARLFGGK